jgi:formate dehydrogenase maturation protein FdhE
MRETWRRRVQRAEDLSANNTASTSLVAFYASLLRAQSDLGERLATRPGWRPTGDLDSDLPALRPHLPAMLRAVAEAAPEALATEARTLLEGGTDRVERALTVFWRAPSDRQFFAKAIVQPYAQWLAETGVAPVGRDVPRADARCPFCGGAPQLSTFRGPGDAAIEGSDGEEAERKLGYFHSPAFDHVGVEACDTCRRYLKGIDLTRLGIAVPLVDEVVSAPLDVWAGEHGYVKIELNLVGL